MRVKCRICRYRRGKNAPDIDIGRIPPAAPNVRPGILFSFSASHLPAE
jgi:hypothetical protein